MKNHYLLYEQVVNTDVKKCWDFFSSPKNLSKITPNHLGFKILSEVPEKMHSGLIIEYRVKPIAGIPVKWITEIQDVNESKLFYDVQLKGPYKVWKHRHHFEAIGDQTIMKDEIEYALPFGILGRIANFLFVRKQVRSIFEYRKRKIEEFFPLK